MSRCGTVFTVLCVALLSGSPSVARELSRMGPHVHVVCDFDNEQIADSVLQTAEAVWLAGADLYRIAGAPLDEPCTVRVYRTIDAYLAADSRLTGGLFQKNLAFAHHATKSAHVALQPPCSDALLAEIGLPYQARALIAHEVAHLVRFHAFRNFESHPRWLADGTAFCLEVETLIAKGWSPGWNEDPRPSTYSVLVKRLIDSGQLPSVDELLRDAAADLPFYEGYAVHALFFRFLKEKLAPKDFHAILDEARRLGGGEGYRDKLHASLTEMLGAERLSDLDKGLRAYVQGMSPAWREEYRSLDTAADDWLQIAFPDTNALAWRTQPAGKKPYTLRGAVKMLPAEKSQMNVLLDSSDAGFLSVAIVAGKGVVVFRCHAEGPRWEQLGVGRAAGVNVGEKVPFEVKIAKKSLTVKIGREDVLKVDLDAELSGGPWGLGAQAGSAGIWYEVQQSSP
ncbi:MAG: hypothetical protein HY812_16585 [Planctomycetes bacterium]|nr:hypothetical protein [Planctomycetota bacterium]